MSDGPGQLRTSRLSLRPFAAVDLDSLVELDGDPEVMRYLSGGAPTPREMVEETVLPRFMEHHEALDGPGYWAAELRATTGFVGWFALHPVDDRPTGVFELGYRLLRTHWGHGLATEGAGLLLELAFERWSAHEVFGQTYQDNLASRRVMEKLGMRFVRAFRVAPGDFAPTFDASASDTFDGDDVEYAITRAEWDRRERR